MLYEVITHRLLIAHLANHDDVGVLPQRRTQRGRERFRVFSDFPLGHEAFAVAVQVSYNFV